jgi:adenosylmethionine-8-amino-7-oxononanoate aminotransferase
MSRYLAEKTIKAGLNAQAASAVLSRNLRQQIPTITRAAGTYYYTDDGRQLIDACGGSAVACLGHDNARVKAAVQKQMDSVPYCHSQFFTTHTSEKLATKVITSTDGKMARLLTLSSGSEALEAALKVARQYYLELPDPQPRRIHFIARSTSYHGATLKALGLGGHLSRRALFEPILPDNSVKVSQCNTYRQLRPGESSKAYVARLANELDDAFSRFPIGTVCGFVVETVTGASTGSVPPAEGYFAAVKEVCKKHGALLILDEVMCGIGRTGTMHAWQQENVVPNIQVIGKGFGAGYIPISGVLIDHDVNKVLESGSGKFSHGQSFQAHPSACAAALEVQNIIHEEDLLANVRAMGSRLSSSLQAKIGSHPKVGHKGSRLVLVSRVCERQAHPGAVPAGVECRLFGPRVSNSRAVQPLCVPRQRYSEWHFRRPCLDLTPLQCHTYRNRYDCGEIGCSVVRLLPRGERHGKS